MHPCLSILRRSAGRVARSSPPGDSPAFFLLLATAACWGFVAPAPARATAAEFGGAARLDFFATSDLFPGGEVREADTGLHLGLVPEVQFRAGRHVRVKPWAEIELERYHDYPARDLARFGFGVDIRRSNVRLRLFHGSSNDELYFPDPAGDAIVDRQQSGAEIRFEATPGVRLHAGLERETNAFDNLHPDRDDRRWTTRLGVERGEARRIRTALTWFYRDTQSVTNLYSYGQNVLRLDAEGALVDRLHGALRLEAGLRSYRTGEIFASNFSRQDSRWRVFTTLAHPVVGPLRAEISAQWRQTDSTRDSKKSVVRGFGFGLVAQR